MHEYKFIVDGEWCFSPDDDTITDGKGNVNNIIDTRNYLNDGENLVSQLKNYFVTNNDKNKNQVSMGLFYKFKET